MRSGRRFGSLMNIDKLILRVKFMTAACYIISKLQSFFYVLLPFNLSANRISLSACVIVVSKGSPSRIRIVLLISLGITTLPRSSILLTIPVAFIVFVPFKYKFKSARDFAEHFLFALLFFHLCGGLFIYIFLLQFADNTILRNLSFIIIYIME